MERKEITPFQELHAMLTFEKTTPCETVGEVMAHLQNARVSLATNERNRTDAYLTHSIVVSVIEGEMGEGSDTAAAVSKMLMHIEELASAVELAIHRDIVVMETFLQFIAHRS